MNLKTEKISLGSELSLYDPTRSPLIVYAAVLALTKQNEELIECRLTFQVTPELYQRIDAEALFNLQPQMRSFFSGGELLPTVDINIEISLQTNLLAYLAEPTINIDQAADYIVNLSQDQSDHPVLYTENWICLSVKQPQESGEAGYRTFWAYISPLVIAALTSSEEVSEATANFLNQLTKTNLSVVTQKATSDILEEMTDFFKDLTDSSLSSMEKLAEDIVETETPRNQIFAAIVSFFNSDDWQFTKLQGEPLLRIAFQGKNGQWTCYAKAKEEQQQFVFYSLCPIAASQDIRQAIAHFLTRANYGMTIGNFELDYTDGEIRYKTSIDVEGDRLTLALIKRLVYINVAMMDEYLPGIKAVIEQGVSPEEAIRAIEQPNATVPIEENV